MLSRKSPRTPAFGRAVAADPVRAASAPKHRGPLRKRLDARTPTPLRPCKDTGPGEIKKPPRPMSKPVLPPRDRSDLLDVSIPSVSTAESFQGEVSRCKAVRTPSPAPVRSHIQQISKQFQLDKAALARSVSKRLETHSSGPSLDLSGLSSGGSRRAFSICWESR